jgi:hypothetical protein
MGMDVEGQHIKYAHDFHITYGTYGKVACQIWSGPSRSGSLSEESDPDPEPVEGIPG